MLSKAQVNYWMRVRVKDEIRLGWKDGERARGKDKMNAEVKD
jgi:hypothetical protein